MKNSISEPNTFYLLGLCESLLAHLPAWVFGVDEHGKVIWSNNFSTQVIGFDPIELQSREGGLLSLLSPEARTDFKGRISTAFKGGDNKFFTFDTALSHKDRFCIYVGLRAFLFLKQDGRPSILFFMAVDETDKVLLKRLNGNEERLVTLGVMTAEVAHEIKNSLISIGALARLMKKKCGEGQREGLDLIEREACRLERFARSVNALARPSGPGGGSRDILSVLKKSLCLLSPEIRKKNIKISLELHKDTKHLSVDSDMLMVVFVNLIRNAMGALPARGRLWIKSRVGQEGLSLEFVNKMIKKRIHVHETLFTPLDQGGTSIGLPFSHKIVENMGGRLCFKRDGDLAVFSIFFPKEMVSATS